MKLTTITVSYGETQSLPEYSNVKPQITLGATLDEGDEPELIEAWLWEQARAAVHIEIDLALERAGKAAKHDLAALRFWVAQTRQNSWRKKNDPPDLPRLIVLLPQGRKDDRLVSVYADGDTERLREEHARRLAVRVAAEQECPLIDCFDGDLSRLDGELARLEAERAAAAAEAERARIEAERAAAVVQEQPDHDAVPARTVEHPF